MREQYPFFRDADERTLAVIGGEAVDSDLKGTYQKPYAILTQKRLYCKNEQGNFITDAAALRSVGKATLGQNWFLWATLACITLALVLLCLWYFAMGGRYENEWKYYQAQQTIDNYLAFEVQVSEYRAQLDTYEEAQRQIDEYQKTWDANGYEQILQEISASQRNLESAVRQLDKSKQDMTSLQQQIDDYEKEITSTESSLSGYRSDLSQARTELLSVQAQLSSYVAQVREQYDNRGWPRPLGYERQVQSYNSSISNLNSKISRLQQQIGAVPVKVEELQQKISACQQEVPVYQQKIDDAQAQVNTCQEALAKYTPQIDEIEEVRQNIAKQKTIRDSIDQEHIQSEIQRFGDSEPEYQSAKRTQQGLKLFFPVLVALLVVFVLFLIQTLLKHIKLAVITAWVSCGIGVICFWLTRSYFYGVAPIVVVVLFIVSFPLSLTVLWWNRKKTVFQVTHSTGAFAFIPSLYPAKELKQFAELVKLIQAGEADGK